MSRKHRRFAQNPNNWFELDSILEMLARPLKEDHAEFRDIDDAYCEWSTDVCTAARPLRNTGYSNIIFGCIELLIVFWFHRCTLAMALVLNCGMLSGVLKFCMLHSGVCRLSHLVFCIVIHSSVFCRLWIFCLSAGKVLCLLWGFVFMSKPCVGGRHRSSFCEMKA